MRSQLEGLDRTRYVNVLVFCHQAPFSSGPHGGPHVEDATLELRKRYMPLFHAHHVRLVLSGHEHLFEHWVEHYADAGDPHRMDLVVSGGGGAPALDSMAGRHMDRPMAVGRLILLFHNVR